MKINRLIASAFACLSSLVIMACSCNPEETPSDNESPTNDAAELISITFTAKESEFKGDIDQAAKTVTITYNSKDERYLLTAARAQYQISEGATISPDPAARAINYTVEGGVTLTVTSESGKTENVYTVSIAEYVAPPVPAKPVAMWFDAEANFARLATKDAIKRYVTKCHESGINSIIVDIKPVQGDVLYDSSFLPKCTRLGGATVENRDFDYLDYFIEVAHEYKMRVTVSTTILTMGLPQTKTGPAYEDPYWEDAICIEHLPGGLRKITESTEWGIFAFVNPIHPKVQDYVMKMVEEVMKRYDVDGYALDYCRYQNMNSDFSDLSRSEFEKYIGKAVTNWPNDIYYYPEGVTDAGSYSVGPLYNSWIEWRSKNIQKLVGDIRDKVKSIRPNCDIEYWAASWWPLPHTGQNWASPNKNSTSTYWWASPDYYKTGFADKLDIFQLGAYLSRVYGLYDAESVEYAIDRALKIINGDCKLYGTISCDNKNFDLASAIDLCLQKTDGCMVFELSHCINNNKWGTIREGVDRAWEALGVNDTETIELWH